MKKYLWFLFIFFGCASTKPTITPPPVVVPPEVIKHDTIHITTITYDTTHETRVDTFGISNGILDVRSFGAKGDGVHDDYIPLQSSCDFCIANPKICTTVRLPVGNYRITQSLILQNNGHFFTIAIKGDVSNKSSSDSYLSRITCEFGSGFGLGVQLGRSISIENITLLGRYTFPYSITNLNIGTKRFSDWATQAGINDSRYNPYAGISIDYKANESGSQGGTSDVTIKNCAIKQFMVGIALTPNGSTANDEMINILDDNIEAVRVAIAIGQDQSKTIVIRNFKCWSSTHTIVDGVTYGRGTGGGSLKIDGMNIAGNCNELFNLNTDRFPLSCYDIYSESLFRIGNVGFGAGANFINCSIDFLTGAGMPAADYMIAGQANFYGGCLRYYDNSQTHRMNLSNMTGIFRDMTLNNTPIITSVYPGKTITPTFDNVHLYYSGTTLKAQPFEEQAWFRATLSVDTSHWTATVTAVDGLPAGATVGMYIIGAPCSQCRRYYDPYINPGNCATISIGRITAINGNVMSLDDVSLNANTGYDAVYLDKLN